jgi:probable HAF family extracellular repeat protein
MLDHRMHHASSGTAECVARRQPARWWWLALGFSLCTVPSCSVDDRTPRVDGGGAGGMNTAGSGSGGDASTAGRAGSAFDQGGAGSPSSGGAAGSNVDAGGGSSPRSCGSDGAVCCVDAPACDDGLACEGSSGRCVRCATFEGIGLSPEFTSSTVQGISADGRVVVGYLEDDTGRTLAFRRAWGTSEGIVPLGVLLGGTSSKARAASSDGFAVVGESESTDGLRAFRWSAGTLVNLGTWNAGDLSSSAAGVSADGNAVAITNEAADSSRLALRWLNGSGFTPIIGMEEARAISADGNALVGNRLGGMGNEAVLYTAAGVESLGALAGDSVAFARAISADGNVSIGVSGSCGCRAFRWRAGVLGIADGLERALDTNLDGSILVGNLAADSCSGGSAALWSAGAGAQTIACDLLPDGIIPNGWSLTTVTAISDDGRTIAGEGINPSLASESWVAVLGPDCQTP